ncbi:MAG: hypothetical protein HY658_08325 [Actinobacteria bacterium]|nr:hypothetical protein [Actinomycetota bacterium]
MAWGAFALANVGVAMALARYETIPFHLVWVSLTLVYGFRVWRLRSTAVVLVGVVLLTGTALLVSVQREHEGLDELAEVPLMAAMVVAMVWHARRRQAAVEEARRRAETEHRLLETERAFVRDASHELRTPITVARGHAELLQAALAEGEGAGDVAIVLDELDRLARISDRLLLLAAAEHPGFLNPATVDVGDLLRRTHRRWSAAAPRAWELRVEAEGEVLADEERLEIALDALIENAVNVTAPGERVTLRAFGEDGAAVLEVADSGPGIDAERIDRIFDRFARAETGRSRRNGGTGLGLTIARALVEAHGGTVSVRSRPGAGSIFSVRIPGFVAAGAGAPAPDPAAPLPAASS